MEVVDILIKEIKDMNNETGSNFDIVPSLHSQIPHFSCFNHFLESQYQDDINRYLFSKEYHVPAYNGSYGDYPSRWVSKVNIIASSISRKIKKEQDKLNRSK